MISVSDSSVPFSPKNYGASLFWWVGWPALNRRRGWRPKRVVIPVSLRGTETQQMVQSGAEEKVAWIGGETGPTPRDPGGVDPEAGGIASKKGWTASGIATAAASSIASTVRESSQRGSTIAWIGSTNAWRGSKSAHKDSWRIGEGLRGTRESAAVSRPGSLLPSSMLK